MKLKFQSAQKWWRLSLVQRKEDGADQWYTTLTDTDEDMIEIKRQLGLTHLGWVQVYCYILQFSPFFWLKDEKEFENTIDYTNDSWEFCIR